MSLSPPNNPVLRVARPVADLEATTLFYRDGLGLEILSSFEEQNGIRGVMLGAPGAPYHFEFTTAPPGHPILPAHADDLLVFYLP